jgi:hypothetical protein
MLLAFTKKVLIVGLLLTGAAGAQQTRLDGPFPQVKGKLLPANGGTGIDATGLTGCVEVNNGVYTVSSANCNRGVGSAPTVTNTTGVVAVNVGSTYTAGTITSSTSGTILFTMTFTPAVHRWNCYFWNETTPTDSIGSTQTIAPTTTTLTITGITVNGDILSYNCVNY